MRGQDCQTETQGQADLLEQFITKTCLLHIGTVRIPVAHFINVPFQLGDPGDTVKLQAVLPGRMSRQESLRYSVVCGSRCLHWVHRAEWVTPDGRGHRWSLRGGDDLWVEFWWKQKDASSPDTENSSCKSSLTWCTTKRPHIIRWARKSSPRRQQWKAKPGEVAGPSCGTWGCYLDASGVWTSSWRRGVLLHG